MIKLADFCTVYGINRATVHTARSHGLHPKAYITHGSLIYVDESYFIRRVDWHREALQFTHSMYFYLKHFFSEASIAREAVKGRDDLDAVAMGVHISQKLFGISDKSILNNDIGIYQWAFYRYVKRVERKLRKKQPNFNVEEVLDIRCENHERELRRRR